jgi:hypothetical protein
VALPEGIGPGSEPFWGDLDPPATAGCRISHYGLPPSVYYPYQRIRDPCDQTDQRADPPGHDDPHGQQARMTTDDPDRPWFSGRPARPPRWA